MEPVEGNIIDIHQRQIYPGRLYLSNGRIVGIEPNQHTYTTYLAPGFVDAHVHIESSMLTPEHFSDLVLSKGTVAVVTDPHEIANVAGKEGVTFMVENSRKAGVKCFFGIPSCVPATPYDATGARLPAKEVEELAKTGVFVCLSEMMNVPGVLGKDPEVMKKLEIARTYNLKIDGHAPLLRGPDLQQYVAAGISTDHECSSLEEALEKIQAGMKILIREGSAAKNFEALKELIQTHPEKVMFCTDDAHPDEIMRSGHIDKIVRKALSEGYDLFEVWRIAALYPVEHYRLPVGTLQTGDAADFIRIENLDSPVVLETYIGGRKMYEKGGNQTKVPVRAEKKKAEFNRFCAQPIQEKQLQKLLPAHPCCIEVINNEIITLKSEFRGETGSFFESDLAQDVVKIVYLNRYSEDRKPQVSWIKGTGLKAGAFAGSVAHDSHNILAIGVTDRDITAVINAVIEQKGGLAAGKEGEVEVLPLPVGGIMSPEPAEKVAAHYEKIDSWVKQNGCRLNAPFMTLAFMSLLVIPALRIGEKGLFDYNSFSFIPDM